MSLTGCSWQASNTQQIFFQPGQQQQFSKRRWSRRNEVMNERFIDQFSQRVNWCIKKRRIWFFSFLIYFHILSVRRVLKPRTIPTIRTAVSCKLPIMKLNAWAQSVNKITGNWSPRVLRVSLHSISDPVVDAINSSSAGRHTIHSLFSFLIFCWCFFYRIYAIVSRVKHCISHQHK